MCEKQSMSDSLPHTDCQCPLTQIDMLELQLRIERGRGSLPEEVHRVAYSESISWSGTPPIEATSKVERGEGARMELLGRVAEPRVRTDPTEVKGTRLRCVIILQSNRWFRMPNSVREGRRKGRRAPPALLAAFKWSTMRNLRLWCQLPV